MLGWKPLQIKNAVVAFPSDFSIVKHFSGVVACIYVHAACRLLRLLYRKSADRIEDGYCTVCKSDLDMTGGTAHDGQHSSV
eukprot:scaffold13056_cov14-Prasinocladus_malaysianus.AAC.2